VRIQPIGRDYLQQQHEAASTATKTSTSANVGQEPPSLALLPNHQRPAGQIHTRRRKDALDHEEMIQAMSWPRYVPHQSSVRRQIR